MLTKLAVKTLIKNRFGPNNRIFCPSNVIYSIVFITFLGQKRKTDIEQIKKSDFKFLA